MLKLDDACKESLFRVSNVDKIIFGQQDYAERVVCYLKKISPTEKLHVYSFPLCEYNPTKYDFDFTLYDESLIREEKKIPVIIAFGSKYKEGAFAYLSRMGFTNIIFFDASMDNALKKDFFKREFAQKHQEFSLIDEAKSIVIYMAKSIVDKPLKNYPKTLSPNITPIQVGTDLTDKKIADVTDNTGDNISARNRHFSETTALYWMWKMQTQIILGYATTGGYGRIWILSQKNCKTISSTLYCQYQRSV